MMLCNETRRLLVDRYEKTRNAKGVAEAFGVCEREVYKLAAQKRETGSVDLRVSLRGRKPKLSQEELEIVKRAIEERPDITIRELKEKLKLDISESGLGKAVREKLKFRLKKNSKRRRAVSP